LIFQLFYVQKYAPAACVVKWQPYGRCLLIKSVASIYGQALSGDESGALGSQEDYRLGDVLRTAHPL
jgi:hypothetical protein